MAHYELFSKREKARLKAGQKDVYQYDELPTPFRVQVIHIWNEALGYWDGSISLSFSQDAHAPNGWWSEICRGFAKEKGLFKLSERASNPKQQCCDYLMRATTEDALDLIEMTFGLVEFLNKTNDRYELQRMRLCACEDAVAELNHRFREHGIGYEFSNGEIVRVDSEYVHAEAVRPALQLLNDAGEGFAGPLQEFLDAHERYRKDEYKDAIVSACKAFESTLKSICNARNWAFDPHRDTASKLLEIIFSHELVPSYLQTHFAALRSVLEAGVPTARNRTSGHGQGPTPTDLPHHFVAYVLHLAASNIVFLIESHKALE